jgi:hypothetical protein
MTKPNILEFKTNAEEVGPVPLGVRSEIAEIPVTTPQIEPAAETGPDRAAIVQELEAIVQLRLFGRGRWLADRKACCALSRTMTELRLMERVPDAPDTWRDAKLGKELHLDLYLVFAGCFDEVEIPIILEHYRLIDESMIDWIYAQLEAGADPETLCEGGFNMPTSCFTARLSI